MIILYFHLQPQFKNELFHILHIRITQVVRFHKMALSGRPFMEERLIELVKWLFGCRCIHHSRQYVRFDVISSRVVHDFKTIVRGLSLQYKNFSFFNNGCQTCRTLISDECLQWSPFSWEKPFNMLSFSLCFRIFLNGHVLKLTIPWRSREKNMRGLPFLFSIAASAIPDASVNFKSSTLINNTDYSIIFLLSQSKLEYSLWIV